MGMRLRLRTDCCEHDLNQITTAETDRILALPTHAEKAEAYLAIFRAGCECEHRRRRCVDCKRRRDELYAYLKGHPSAYWCAR